MEPAPEAGGVGCAAWGHDDCGAVEGWGGWDRGSSGSGDSAGFVEDALGEGSAGEDDVEEAVAERGF